MIYAQPGANSLGSGAILTKSGPGAELNLMSAESWSLAILIMWLTLARSGVQRCVREVRATTPWAASATQSHRPSYCARWLQTSGGWSHELRDAAC